MKFNNYFRRFVYSFKIILEGYLLPIPSVTLLPTLEYDRVEYAQSERDTRKDADDER